jgi:hypothetical protein
MLGNHSHSLFRKIKLCYTVGNIIKGGTGFAMRSRACQSREVKALNPVAPSMGFIQKP